MDENEIARSLALDYKQTYGSPEGKRVLAHMKKMANYNIVVVPLDNLGRIDPYEVMRQQTLRSVIVGIETMLNKDPDEEKGIRNEPNSTASDVSYA